jgi:hypothetical protein
MVMTAGGRGGSVTRGWSVDTAGLSRMRRVNHAGSGSASMTVHGSRMGVVAYTTRAREGHTGCEGTVWESETSVRCLVGHGAGGSRRLVMTVSSRGGSVTQGWSIDTAALSRMRRMNHAAAGSASMTVHGSSMGVVAHTVRGRGGHTGCEGTVWQSETSVRCLVGNGSGGTRRVVMTAGGRRGSVTQGWSVDTPDLSRMRRLNHAGTGSASITVHGSSMGLVAHTVRGRMGHTGCEGTAWQSETSVRCLVGHGSGGTHRVVMTTWGRGGSVTQGWSVDTPGVSRMRRANRAAAGLASMTVHGSGMGVVAYTARGREGHTGCEGTVWQSETSVRCLVGQGAGGTRRVVMTVGGRWGSVTQGWSVDISGLSGMRRVNHAGTGSASMTVHGSGMGVVAHTARGSEGHTGCEGTAWESETAVRCLLGHGAGGTRRMVMTAGGRGGSVTQGWSIDTSALSRMRRMNHAAAGSASMTVHGSSMGVVLYTVRGRGGHTGCEGTVWQSETSVRCLVGNGSGGTRRVVMTAGGRGRERDAGLVGRHT